MQTYFLSVLAPIAAGGHRVTVYRLEHSAGLQWTREHADEIAQRAHGAGYCALMVRDLAGELATQKADRAALECAPTDPPATHFHPSPLRNLKEKRTMTAPYYVMLDDDQSADCCDTLEAARASGRAILERDPLACSVSIQDANGAHVEDIGDNFAQTVGAGLAYRSTAPAQDIGARHKLTD